MLILIFKHYPSLFDIQSNANQCSVWVWICVNQATYTHGQSQSPEHQHGPR